MFWKQNVFCSNKELVHDALRAKFFVMEVTLKFF